MGDEGDHRAEGRPMIGGRMMQVGMGLLVAVGITVVVLALAVSLAEAGEAAAPATTVSLGTVLAPWLEVIVLVLGSPIAAALVAVLLRVARRLGVELEETSRGRLQEMIERGLALGADAVGHRLDGRLPVDVRSTVIHDAAIYLRRYGRETLVRLRQDPGDAEAIKELVAARLAVVTSTGPPATVTPPPPRKRTRKAAATTRPAP